MMNLTGNLTASAIPNSWGTPNVTELIFDCSNCVTNCRQPRQEIYPAFGAIFGLNGRIFGKTQRLRVELVLRNR
jgi:hypothetical protein